MGWITLVPSKHIHPGTSTAWTMERAPVLLPRSRSPYDSGPQLSRPSHWLVIHLKAEPHRTTASADSLLHPNHGGTGCGLAPGVVVIPRYSEPVFDWTVYERRPGPLLPGASGAVIAGSRIWGWDLLACHPLKANVILVLNFFRRPIIEAGSLDSRSSGCT